MNTIARKETTFLFLRRGGRFKGGGDAHAGRGLSDQGTGGGGRGGDLRFPQPGGGQRDRVFRSQRLQALR